MSTLNEVKRKAIDYIQCSYGNLISLEDPVFDEKEKLWSVKLKTDYPRLIVNDEPNERVVRTLNLNDLGTLFFTEDLKIMKENSTSRTDCANLLRTRLNTWEERAENIVVKTSSLQLANTGMARVFLNPISTIIANFLQDDDKVISIYELANLQKTQRYLQWIRLLEDLELVRKTEDGYVYGNMFTELRRKVNNEKDFLTHILAYVLRERYPVLKEVFKLRQFEPLVHLDSCYYRPALEAKKVLFQRAESLYSRYLQKYTTRPRLELPVVLFELWNSDALHKRGNLYFANEELFDEMLGLSENYQTISSPRL